MVAFQEDWPEWWHWELDCSNPHLVKRMLDRSFNEVDLRAMLDRAITFAPDIVPGRWLIVTRHENRAWNVIVEPQDEDEILVVVTAFAVE